MTFIPAKPLDVGDQPLDLNGAFIRRTTLDGASLRGANLTRADMTGASARGADFKNANLKKTILRGTDLSGAKNLTHEQLAEAILDETTKLPDYINRAVIKQRQRGSRGKLF